MILSNIHTLLDFGTELEVVQAIFQDKTGDSINGFDECERNTVPQTLLYKAAVRMKRLVLEALISHPFIDVDMSKAQDCPLLKVISTSDYHSVCIILRHPGYIPKDFHECVSKAFASKNTGILPILLSHACAKGTKRTTRTLRPAPLSPLKPTPPAGKPPARPPQPPPPPVPGTSSFVPKEQENMNGTTQAEQATPPLFSMRVDSPVRTAQEWSWLAVRLHKAGFDYQLVRDCERKLVAQEGFMSATLFATLPAAELTFAYLDKIGIVGKGLQLELMQIHRALQPTTNHPKEKKAEEVKCKHENTAVMQETLRELTKSNAILQQALQNQQCVISQLADKLATM